MRQSTEVRQYYEAEVSVTVSSWNETSALVGHVELEVSDQHGGRSGKRRVAVMCAAKSHEEPPRVSPRLATHPS